MSTAHLDEQLDLVLERVVPLPREAVWRAWTEPELLKQWFTPAPWKTVACELDLRPGGAFKTVMRSPDGAEFPGAGCYLEVVRNERMVWTSALQPGFRPAAEAPHALAFTAVITLAPADGGTRYRAVAMHADRATCERHAAMGFHVGWGAALDQLVALMSKR